VARTVPPRPADPALQTEVVDREGRSMRTFFIMLGVMALGAIGVVIFKNTARPDPDEGLPAPAAATAAAEAPKVQPPPQPPKVEQPKAGEPRAATEKPTAQAKDEGAGRDDNADAPKAGSRAVRAIEATKGKDNETKLAPEAAKDLDEAEAALAAGKPADALRLAQHSLYAQKSSRAYAVITRARCAQGDLGNAKAALAQVSARDRSSVVRACGKLGVELH
jgi:hypothetical protein